MENKLNLRLLEVYVKNIKKDSGVDEEYETAVDINRTRWESTKYKLFIDIYDGITIEFTKTTFHHDFYEIWPEDNNSIHQAPKEQKTSVAYDCRVHFSTQKTTSLVLDNSTISSITTTSLINENTLVMLPFKQNDIEKLFNESFSLWLKRKIAAAKRINPVRITRINAR